MGVTSPLFTSYSSPSGMIVGAVAPLLVISNVNRMFEKGVSSVKEFLCTLPKIESPTIIKMADETMAIRHLKPIGVYGSPSII